MVHDHGPQKRRGRGNGQGPRYCHDGSEQMEWESMGIAMGHEPWERGGIRMSHALLT